MREELKSTGVRLQADMYIPSKRFQYNSNTHNGNTGSK